MRYHWPEAGPRLPLVERDEKRGALAADEAAGRGRAGARRTTVGLWACGLLVVTGSELLPSSAVAGRTGEVTPSRAVRAPIGPPVPLSHGPLLGAVTGSSVKIWARADLTAPATTVLSVEYGELGGAGSSLGSQVTLSQEGDFTGTVELTDLESETSYWYQLRLDGLPPSGGDGSFRTPPAGGVPSTFRFALGSCNDHLQMPYPVFSSILAEEASFLIHLGDIIYADRTPAATTRAAFEARYRLNFGESHWRSLMRQLPTFMTWDDHEIENDWSQGETGLYLEARPAFDDYVASHNPSPRLPGELYYDFAVGEADFFVLDTRSHRDAGSAPTMLGTAQMAELESWLLASSARFKFIVSSVQWSFLAQKTDTWFGFQAERQQIFDLVRDRGVGGVVLLSGDRHWVGLFRHEEAAPFYLYELSSSPLGAAIGTAPAPDGETLFLADSGRAFMTVDVDTTQPVATLDVRVLDEGGAVLYSLSLAETDISPLPIFFDGFESGDISAW